MLMGTPSPPGVGPGLGPALGPGPGPGLGLGLGPDPGPGPGPGLGPDDPEPDPLRRLSPGEGDFLRIALSLFPKKHTLIFTATSQSCSIYNVNNNSVYISVNVVNNLDWWVVLSG